MAANRTAPADRCTRCRAGGRPPRYQRHHPCVEERLSLVRLPARIWSTHNDLQSIYALGAAWDLGESVPGACRERTMHGYPDDRLSAREGTQIGVRWKRGEQKQAVGRSRGGRNTKIHALADAKGRLLAILLTGGEAHDCPVAERLIRRAKPAKRMLGDKAYDSAELRDELDERGTKPVIPNRCNRIKPFSFSKRLYKLRSRIGECIQQVEGFQANRYPLRQARAKLPCLRLPRGSPCLVDLMSRDPRAGWV
jgi:transposase